MNVPWMHAAGAEFGAAWLLREIAPVAGFGRRARGAERAYLPGQEAQAQAAVARVHAVAREATPESLAALSATLAACPEPASAQARAATGTLADADLFELSRFLDAVHDVRSLASHPAFAEIGLPPLQQALADELERGRGPNRSFYVADGYDASLTQARSQAAAARARFDAERSRIAVRVAATLGIDHVRDGEFIVMRSLAQAAMPMEVRVLREAPTYFLCELALDDSALTALAALDAAEFAVAEREEAVRERLTLVVRAANATLDEATNALGAIDSFVARARFAQRHRGCVPEVAAGGALRLRDARYLPLEEALLARAHAYVPLALELEGIAVLTGPNMGGKSAALRTCGFIAACVALGLPAPAASARVPLYDEIAWLGSGGTAEDSSLLSSFGREVVVLRDFLGRRRRRPLVLVDEFARTTSPAEGRALLLALVATLQDCGASGIAATHLSRIAEDAAVPHFAVAGLREIPRDGGGAVDLDAALERIAAVMDYRVSRVQSDSPGRADALALAAMLGLDEALVAKARAVL